MQKRSSYPLQWPEGWKRHVNRGMPPFSANNFGKIRDSILRRLRKRGTYAVITSDLPVRNDGQPYADARCQDPGVAVWWVEKGKEMVIACDRWKSLSHNLSAILRTLEAMDGIQRWGADSMVDRAFAGFAALPPPGATSDGTDEVMPAAMPNWREVFNFPGAFESLSASDKLAFVKLRYRERISQAHPDRGGDDINQAVILNAAMEAAEKELGV